MNIKAGEITLPWISRSDTVYTLSTTNHASSKNNVTHPITHSLTHSLTHSIVFYKVDSTQLERSIISLIFFPGNMSLEIFEGANVYPNFPFLLLNFIGPIILGYQKNSETPNNQYPKQKHYIR